MKKYIIEFYYKGELIEQREYDDFFIVPQVGDIITIHFSNPSYSQESKWWVVTERRQIFFSIDSKTLRQTLMLNIIPDLKNGLWKTDPLYVSHEK